MTSTPHKLFIGDPLNEAVKQVLITQRDDLLEACKEMAEALKPIDYITRCDDCKRIYCECDNGSLHRVKTREKALAIIAAIEGIDGESDK